MAASQKSFDSARNCDITVAEILFHLFLTNLLRRLHIQTWFSKVLVKYIRRDTLKSGDLRFSKVSDVSTTW